MTRRAGPAAGAAGYGGCITKRRPYRRFLTDPRQSGVRRLVPLAGHGQPEAEETEDAVRASGEKLTLAVAALRGRAASSGNEPTVSDALGDREVG